MSKARRDRRLQFEWMEEHVIKLIDAVKEAPLLWDRPPTERLTKKTGTMIWNRISRQVFDSQISPTELNQKWQNIRSQYKEYVNRLQLNPNCSMVVQWKYFNRMRFLSRGRRTHSAIFTNVCEPDVNVILLTDDESCDNNSIQTISTNDAKQFMELPELPEHMDESEFVNHSINIVQRYEAKPLIEIPELQEQMDEKQFEVILKQKPDSSTTTDQSVQTTMPESIVRESQPVRDNSKSIRRDEILSEALKLVQQRPTDDSQIFADYVALQMRRLSAAKRQALEIKIQRSILETIDEPDVKEEVQFHY